MQAIENLLWGGVFMAIEDREDIIFSVSCHTVLFENLQRHRDELKGQQFLRFVTGIVYTAFNDVLITQPCNIAEIHPCREIGE